MRFKLLNQTRFKELYKRLIIEFKVVFCVISVFVFFA